MKGCKGEMFQKLQGSELPLCGLELAKLSPDLTLTPPCAIVLYPEANLDPWFPYNDLPTWFTNN